MAHLSPLSRLHPSSSTSSSTLPQAGKASHRRLQDQGCRVRGGRAPILSSLPCRREAPLASYWALGSSGAGAHAWSPNELPPAGSCGADAGSSGRWSAPPASSPVGARGELRGALRAPYVGARRAARKPEAREPHGPDASADPDEDLCFAPHLECRAASTCRKGAPALPRGVCGGGPRQLRPRRTRPRPRHTQHRRRHWSQRKNRLRPPDSSRRDADGSSCHRQYLRDAAPRPHRWFPPRIAHRSSAPMRRLST
jgi:hypothetical protein